MAGENCLMLLKKERGELFPNYLIIFTSNQAEIYREVTYCIREIYRVPKADRWKQGGTGLGLALVQS